MHALEDEALVATLHGEHAFHAVDVAALYAEEFADPIVEFFAVEVAGGADADAGDGVVVRVRGVIILLPAGLRGFTHHLDVERVFAAGFEDQIETGSIELEDKRAVALGEKETVERGAGDDRVAVFEAGLPVGEDVDGGVARGGDCGEGGGGGEVAVGGQLHGHDDDIEFVLVAVVMVVVLVVAVRVIVAFVGVVVTSVIVVVMADDECVGADGEGVGAGPFEGVFGLEELGVHIDGATEVEAADVEDVVERDVGVLGAVDFRDGVNGAYPEFEGVEFGGGDEVGFVENDDVGEGELLDGFVVGAEVLEDMFGVDDGDDGIEAEVGLHLVVGEKRLRDGAGIREAGGLDENAVELVLALHETAEDADEIAADGAADTAVVHLEELFVGLDDELVIYADLAEFVFDDREFLAVLFGEDAIEERGFAGAEEAGEDGDRNRHGRRS